MKQLIVFDGDSIVRQGPILEIAKYLKRKRAIHKSGQVIMFDSESGHQADLDLSGSSAELEERYLTFGESESTESALADSAPKRGRPKLGVVGREVTLLPRHWDWLETQSGGASAALRRLVDQARKEMSGKEMIRQSQDAAQRFMTAIAGNLPGYEEAVRALYACDKARFDHETTNWPADIRKCARKYADHALR